MYNIGLSKEEYDLIMDLRCERKIYKNEYIIKEKHTEIIIRDKFYNEKCRVLIDTNDIDLIKNIRWYFGANGYIMGHTKDRKNITLHKVLTKTGQRELVDHINGNKLDNRRENLRLATHQQNNFNKKALGVRKTKSKKYQAYITYNKKQINLGVYEDFNDAVVARKNGEKKYFKEYAYKGV